MLLMMFVLWVIQWSKRFSGSRLTSSAVENRRRRRAKIPLDPQLATLQAPWHRTRAKPPWVGAEIVRMKAFGKNLGYKRLPEAFNRPLMWPRNPASYPGFAFTDPPLNLPAGHFGLGHGSGAHAPNEYYVIESTHPKIDGYDGAILSFAEFLVELGK